jgi:two-component system phosphate regulon sensor histidine kinase PhoR
LRSYQWRIAIPFFILILVSMGALGVYLTRSVHDSQLNSLRRQLEYEARLTSEAALSSLSGQGDAPGVLAGKLGREIDTRITIIAPDGTVLGDSSEDPARMENHLTRPEVQAALAGGMGESTRYSATLKQNMMYVAVTVNSQGKLLGIARVALPLTTVQNSVNNVTRTIIIAAVIIAVVAVLAAWLIARTTTRPIRELTRASRKIAGGQLGQKISVTRRDEIGQLAAAFNEMSANLTTTMEAISTEKTKLADILANMADGVIMTDKDGNVVLTNPAAERLFGFKAADALARPLIEVVRDYEVEDVVRLCLKTGSEQNTQFETGLARHFLRVIAVPVREQGQLNGALVLLQDLTEMKNMQTMRRELVGNISHELRTPIAGIKAMVETLRGGAIDDRAAAQNFLSRIEDEVDRLAQMVAELTQLSRIESGRAELKKEPVEMGLLIGEVLNQMGPLAEKQSVTLASELPAGLPTVQVDKDRIRQTVINLVHNAIKFNRPGGAVNVSAAFDDNSVTVSVADNGIGISPGDLPHVFERFFKADKSRAGSGSGLGLAIAKHTVQAHGGDIRATSQEGKGSTFSFTIPRRA